MEEKWEEEMIDSVGGTSEWACLGDDEKKELRRAKWAREMGDWDDQEKHWQFIRLRLPQAVFSGQGSRWGSRG